MRASRINRDFIPRVIKADRRRRGGGGGWHPLRFVPCEFGNGGSELPQRGNSRIQPSDASGDERDAAKLHPRTSPTTAAQPRVNIPQFGDCLNGATRVIHFTPRRLERYIFPKDPSTVDLARLSCIILTEYSEGRLDSKITTSRGMWSFIAIFLFLIVHIFLRINF